MTRRWPLEADARRGWRLREGEVEVQKWIGYGMRRGKCRGGRPDLDGDVRSEGLTGSIGGAFWKDGVTGSELYSSERDEGDPRECALDDDRSVQDSKSTARPLAPSRGLPFLRPPHRPHSSNLQRP